MHEPPADSTPAGNASVDGDFNYAGLGAARPVYYQYEPEPGKPAPLPPVDKRTMHVRDISTAPETVDLDTEGVLCVDDPAPDLEWLDADAVKKTYYPACIELVKTHAGAVRVHAFDHNGFTTLHWELEHATVNSTHATLQFGRGGFQCSQASHGGDVFFLDNLFEVRIVMSARLVAFIQLLQRFGRRV